MAGPCLRDIFSKPSSWQIRLQYEFSQSKKKASHTQAEHYRQRWPLGLNILKGKNSENKQISPPAANYCIWLINISYPFVCLLDFGAECYQFFARRSFQSQSESRPACSSAHNNFLPPIFFNFYNFLSPVTTRLRKLSALFSVVSVFVFPSPSPDDHNRSTDWFPISPSISFFLSLTHSLALHIIHSFIGPRDFLGLAPVNYPATRRYILNVTFLTLSHASCLPPTISPLFRCECFPGGAA